MTKPVDILTESKLKELDKLAKSMDPSAKVLLKDSSTLMKTLNLFICLFNKRFMTHFATTLCHRIYIPEQLLHNNLRRLVAHEVLGHVKQVRTLSLGLHPLVGFLLYAILYTLIFLPIKLAYFRYFFERDAEYKALSWAIKDGSCSVSEAKIRFASFAKTVAGADYLYPWRKKWVIDGFAEKAKKGFT